jgi:hypothetical protein
LCLINTNKSINDFSFHPSVSSYHCSVSVLVLNYSYHKDERAKRLEPSSKICCLRYQESYCLLFFNLLLFCSPLLLFSYSCLCFSFIFLIYSCSLLYRFLAIHYKLVLCVPVTLFSPLQLPLYYVSSVQNKETKAIYRSGLFVCCSHERKLK